MNNLTFKVQLTPPQSKRFQKEVFAKGGTWVEGETTVLDPTQPFMVLRQGRMHASSEYGERYFRSYSAPEVLTEQAFKLVAKALPIKLTYVLDDRGHRVAVREDTGTSPSVLDEATPGLRYLWKLGKTTMYNKQSGITTHYENEHRQDILAKAYKLYNELNGVKQ